MGLLTKGCPLNNMLPTQATASAPREPPLGPTLPSRVTRAWDPKACCCWSPGQSLSVPQLSDSPEQPLKLSIMPRSLGCCLGSL